ncbi:MAG: hypothetical protein U0793_02025 [Gemmataceae bacterium]
MLVRLSLALMIVAAAGGAWLWVESRTAYAPAAPAIASRDVEGVRARALRLFDEATAFKSDARQAREKFRHAAGAFQEAADLAPSAGAYQDAGAAQLLGGRLPQAIFAFRQGLKLDPDDADLRQRLRYARALVPHSPAERGKTGDDWPLWAPTLPTLLRLGALLCYSLVFFGAVLAITRRRAAILVWATAGAVLFFVQIVAFGRLRDERPLVVVAAEDVQLRTGNGASYPAHPEAPYLPPGLEAHAVAKRGGWLLIELSGGETGWVARDNVLLEKGLENTD